MSTPWREISAFPSLSLFRLLAPGTGRWRDYYPFTEENGAMTLLGRTALFHGLQSQNLAGATILVPNYHEGVEIDTLLAAGCKLVYYRVKDDLEVDLEDVATRLEGADVLYVIHYFGFPQPMDQIMRFSRKHRLKVIEDCALAMFSQDTGGWLGRHGDISIFSVHKTCATPGLGYLLSGQPLKLGDLEAVSSKSTVLQSIKLFRRHLRSSPLAFVERAFASLRRLVTHATSVDIQDELNHEKGQWDPQMSRLAPSGWSRYLLNYSDPEKIIEKRRRNFNIMVDRLTGHATLPTAHLPEGVCPLFFPVLVDMKHAIKGRLAELGVESINFWSRIHHTCPNDLGLEVRDWRTKCLALGIHQNLSEKEVDRQATIFRRVMNELSKDH